MAIVICHNDFPFAVCAPGTTHERAQELAKQMQAADLENVRVAERYPHPTIPPPVRVFYHVHDVPELNP